MLIEPCKGTLRAIYMGLHRIRGDLHPSSLQQRSASEHPRYRHNMLGVMSDRHDHSDIEESCISLASISQASLARGGSISYPS
jgi:hypothetical protein